MVYTQAEGEKSMSVLIRWLRKLLGLEKAPIKPEAVKPLERPKKFFTPPPIRLPKPERRLPTSFTNRPGVKQAQVNLKKAGYKKDAKIEEDQPRRRRHE